MAGAAEGAVFGVLRMRLGSPVAQPGAVGEGARLLHLEPRGAVRVPDGGRGSLGVVGDSLPSRGLFRACQTPLTLGDLPCG